LTSPFRSTSPSATETVQHGQIPSDESLLLGSRPFLDLGFALASLIHCLKGLGVGESDRTSAGSEARSAAGVVGGNPSGYIRRRADVVCAVSTAKDVDEEATAGRSHESPLVGSREVPFDVAQDKCPSTSLRTSALRLRSLRSPRSGHSTRRSYRQVTLCLDRRWLAMSERGRSPRESNGGKRPQSKCPVPPPQRNSLVAGQCRGRGFESAARYVAEKTIRGLDVEFGFDHSGIEEATAMPACLRASGCCLTSTELL